MNTQTRSRTAASGRRARGKGNVAKRTAGRALLVVVTAAVAVVGMPAVPAGAVVPGPNGQIAFAGNRTGDFDIFSMNTDGSAQTNLSQNAADDREPDWGTAVAPPACTITGTAGNDMLFGTLANDVICGLGGDDDLFGQNGDDTLFGGTGKDELFGGNGDDSLFGGDANDILFGNNGDDDLSGEGGNDNLFGNLGNDDLSGAPGNDSLFGGPGINLNDGGPGTNFCSNPSAGPGC